MPVSTTSAAVHITPVVLNTFLKHYKQKTQRKVHDVTEAKQSKEEATDQLIFDEAFHIVKAFIKLGTENTVESLQAFTNTHIPAPYWVVVIPISVPMLSCNRAADLLISWFGPEELAKVVGGERWWQVRGLDGIDAEWITERNFLGECTLAKSMKRTEDEETLSKMEGIESVMLYVHGGGYFWGSINTHRYQIIRYARKMKGRAFAVNYRKAPQYPWPCPLQDALAAYMYLIDPPPGAPHKAISPSKIVLAGDSAGAALCLTVLTVLRDMGVPQPAGAVLISPWVDLTHSFESVMTNMDTDIMPQYGFVHKPSLTWPVYPVGDKDHPRIRETRTSPPPEPGHADTLKPTSERQEEQDNLRKETKHEESTNFELAPRQDKSTAEHLHSANGQDGLDSVSTGATATAPAGDERAAGSGTNSTASGEMNDIDRWEPKAPKVLMEDVSAVPLEIGSQIQQYATNEQLSHPLVSPILQGSLGNLCPLYIIAGDGELLRDEIIHIAHRAAHPEDYPTRKGALVGHRQMENAKKFTTPTKVHLQVYDGMPHVLTVFTFTDSGKYAYQSIAQFARHVTMHSEEHVERNPFPELHRPECRIHIDNHVIAEEQTKENETFTLSRKANKAKKRLRRELHEDLQDIMLYKGNEKTVAQDAKSDGPDASLDDDESRVNVGEEAREAIVQSQDIPHVLMIRERVDIHGQVRPMEPQEEMPALQIKPCTIGIIKEAPVRRWLTGQEAMDKKYAKRGRRILKKRLRIENVVEKMLMEAREQGLELTTDSASQRDEYHSGRRRAVSVASASSGLSTTSSMGSSIRIDADRRWGPLDLDGEHPPKSAIAGRRDTPEALALIKKSVYHTAPATHMTVPKMHPGQIIRAAFNPNNLVSTAPQQSVSEQQVRKKLKSVHGLSIWNTLLSYATRQTHHGKKAASNAMKQIAEAVEEGMDYGSPSVLAKTPPLAKPSSAAPAEAKTPDDISVDLEA